MPVEEHQTFSCRLDALLRSYVYSAERAVFRNPSQPPQTTGTTGNGEGLSGPHGGQFSIVLPQ
jgi:hypothetical protein